MVKSFRFCSTITACRPRCDSLPLSTYAGNADCRGLLGPAAAHGQSLALYTQPLAGFSTLGASSNDSRPFHSLAGSLPSTGCFQSNFGSRRGMKFACRYATFPSACAKSVLLDEFVSRSLVFWDFRRVL